MQQQSFLSGICAALTDFADRWKIDHPDDALRLFVLADPAQDRTAWQRLTAHSFGTRTLIASNASELTPHLLDMGPMSTLSAALTATLSRRHRTTAFTLIGSPVSLPELHTHLQHFCDVRLSGDYEMLLAVWDPAILGTLVGQADDDTLHVPGPVFEPEQLHAFLQPMAAWWYCDREDQWHRVEKRPLEVTASDAKTRPLILNQAQEDALVEASVPDQVLYHLEQNRPTLFDQKLPHARRYRFVRAVLPSARKLGLEGMRDLTSFVALCLIYRQRIETDPQILHLLDQVQRKALTLDDALKVMPA